MWITLYRIWFSKSTTLIDQPTLVAQNNNVETVEQMASQHKILLENWNPVHPCKFCSKTNNFKTRSNRFLSYFDWNQLIYDNHSSVDSILPYTNFLFRYFDFIVLNYFWLERIWWRFHIYVFNTAHLTSKQYIKQSIIFPLGSSLFCMNICFISKMVRSCWYSTFFYYLSWFENYL